MMLRDKYEKIMDICKRRGILWPSYEIYGGLSGFVDLGPVGVLIINRIMEEWRDLFVRKQGNVEISTPILAPSIVFKASGHLSHFKDPMVECGKCHRRFRADQLLSQVEDSSPEGLSLRELQRKLSELGVRCPDCGGELSKPRYFLTMFKTIIGPYKSFTGYARPEAAQGMFVDFKRVFESSRERLPIGIAQIGKALRNEISPRQGPIRLREFTIMEFEFFYDPLEDKCERLPEVSERRLRIVTCENRLSGKEEPLEVTVREALDKNYIYSEWMAYFMALSTAFLEELGIPRERQKFHEKLPNERAHYSKQTFDQEVLLDRWGWTEIAGFAHRSDYDLKGHMKYSKVDLTVYRADPPHGRRIIPHVVEPSFGAERLLYAVLEYALTVKEDRIILSLPKRVAPYHLAVFPLLTREPLVIKAREIHDRLLSERFDVYYDEKGSIGRRYARADEIGIPLALTVDYQTLEDDTATLRDRDTWDQLRIPLNGLSEILLNYYRDNNMDFKGLEKIRGGSSIDGVSYGDRSYG
ncbi:MAG: glycine--tRNA ligase [Candidatus Bathyarchaeia archaeon]